MHVSKAKLYRCFPKINSALRQIAISIVVGPEYQLGGGVLQTLKK